MRDEKMSIDMESRKNLKKNVKHRVPVEVFGTYGQRGGWGPLIQSVRRILLSIIGDSLVDDETLLTAFAEVEKITDDRPLMKLTSDPNDDTALTLNHILLLYRNPAIIHSG
ncbi:hypothetical protein FGIG_11739 [Fasciola gigantica]|uniref:Uncharacterized protein n=1 Tax=Fasciola gigantica TaxID=46835 RepID=A0A504YQ41_FASGI|nr:hypothetical protein FGIG_11739 [Fasciola gigantica]